MKKAKYLLMGFLLLMLIGFYASINVRAVEYTCDPEPNTAYIYSIKSVDVEGLEDIWEPYKPKDVSDGLPYLEWQWVIFYTFEGVPLGPWGLERYDDHFYIGRNVDEEGAKFQLKVDYTKLYKDYYPIYDWEEEDEDFVNAWSVYVDMWETIDPDDDFNPTPTWSEDWFWLFEDPDDYNRAVWNEDEEDGAVTIGGVSLDNWWDGWIDDMRNTPYLDGILIPTPVNEYLDELEWLDDEDMEEHDAYWLIENATWTDWEDYYDYWDGDWDSDWIPDDEWDSDEIENDWEYNSADMQVVHDGTFPWWDIEDEEWEYEDYEEEWTFDEETGWLELYQVLDGADVLLEIGVEEPAVIFGYELPILLGITAAFTIGLIYIIRRKAKSVKN